MFLPVEYFDFDETTNKEFKSYKFKKLIYEKVNLQKKLLIKIFIDHLMIRITQLLNSKNLIALQVIGKSLNLLNENKDYIKTSLSKNNILKDAINSEVSSKETLLHEKKRL